MTTAQIIRDHLRLYNFNNFPCSSFMCNILKVQNRWDVAEEVQEFTNSQILHPLPTSSAAMYQVVLQYIPLMVYEMAPVLLQLYQDWDNREQWLESIKAKVNPEHKLYRCQYVDLKYTFCYIRAENVEEARAVISTYTPHAVSLILQEQL